MRYTKRIAVLFFSLLLMVGAAVTSVEAQRRAYRVYRPVVRPYWGWHDPFWGSRRYDPFYDPYYYDPAYREYRDRYYLKKDVANARRDLAKNREKYMKDGYIDPKEQEKLAKAERKYRERLAKLQKFDQEH
jgi:hypothetical protein